MCTLGQGNDGSQTLPNDAQCRCNC